MKRITVFLLALMMVLALVPTVALAAGTVREANSEAALATALGAAASGDTVKITADLSLTTTYTIPAGVTLTASSGVVVSVSGAGYRLYMMPGSTIDGLTIVKTDKAGVQNIIYVQSNCTVKNCSISGQFALTDNDVTRAMEICSGSTDILIQGNIIRALRQPAYVNRCTGEIKNNQVFGTKGWVVCSDAECTLTGNVFGGNVFDIAIIAQGTNAGAYDDVAALSAANNGAYVEYQLSNPRMYASGGIAFPAGGGTTEVTAGVDPTYTIVIPAAVNFGTLQKDSGLQSQAFDVKAQNVIIEDGRHIAVSVTSPSDFKLASGGVLLGYQLFNSGASALTSGDTFATFSGNGTQNGRVQVDTSLIANAGSYQDTMTFTIVYQ